MDCFTWQLPAAAAFTVHVLLHFASAAAITLLLTAAFTFLFVLVVSNDRLVVTFSNGAMLLLCISALLLPCSGQPTYKRNSAQFPVVLAILILMHQVDC
jgi:hypothetical protein